MKHLKLLLLIISVMVFTNVPAATKDFTLHRAVLDNDLKLTQRLLSTGAAIDVIGSRKYGYGSALHLAVREGNLDIAKLLLDRGADVDVLDPDDFTPLHNAAWNGNLDMVKLLLAAGADIEASTYDGDTPLKLAQNNDQTQVAEFIQAKIQAPSATRTKVESPVIADSRVIDISGTYIAETTASGMNQTTRQVVKNMNGKLIVLKQTGNTITGSVGSQSNWIKGTREGNIINFYIIHFRGSEINGSWEINADATNLEGKWFTNGGGGASGIWNLTKIESTPPPSLTGTYIADISGSKGLLNFLLRFPKSGSNQEIELVQNGNQITGTFDDGRNGGKIYGDIEGDTIRFEWHTSNGGLGKGKWTVKPGSNEIVGNFHKDANAGRPDDSGKWNLSKIE